MGFRQFRQIVMFSRCSTCRMSIPDVAANVVQESNLDLSKLLTYIGITPCS